ncbi:MAG: hypothetical protein ACD_49C00038G0037 [uncultured bacterium (gcode 4)]|uniref:Uncharacterized protein n=1 Tax=uncultured bacterium (gcode 4) TaxID=1234023 RepID=K2BCI7_9BACT|nr:MAG: hypothetical protein ACD_49C00038G0037 [uncultured bacterium (gcode 4)]
MQNNKLLFLLILVWFLILYHAFVLIKIRKKGKIIKNEENEIISLFFSKVNKLPAFIEIMKKYVNYPDVFEELIHLHKLWIIYNISSIYDLLSLNSRINKEFIFLMKLSAKIQDIHKDWNFLYIKNYILFYEKDIEKEISEISSKIENYNKLLKIKNYLLIWLLFPISEKIEL